MTQGWLEQVEYMQARIRELEATADMLRVENRMLRKAKQNALEALEMAARGRGVAEGPRH